MKADVAPGRLSDVVSGTRPRFHAMRREIPISRERLREMLQAAVRAATTAGGYALTHRARRCETVHRAAHDVKLRLDLECQAQAEQVIRRLFPNHAVMGEEDGAIARTAAECDFQWIIDPIDGTVNFSHGLPFWCCSVAIAWRGMPIAGTVYAPQTGECFTASLDDRSRRNGRPIRVSSVRRLDRSIVFTGLDKNLNPALPPFEIFRHMSTQVQKARIMGSAALDMCHVACGNAEGYFESGIYIWDVAAAGLIVEQAGGRAELLGALPDGRLQFMATNGRIHSALKNLLKKKLNLARESRLKT